MTSLEGKQAGWVGRTALSVVALLVGCGPAMPGDEELRQAMQTAIDEQLAATGKMGALAMDLAGIQKIRVSHLEKVSCKPDGEKAAICDMVIEVSIDGEDKGLAAVFGLNGTRKGVETHRLVKTQAGWIVADSLNPGAAVGNAR
jgi:hypothetical protein